MIKLIDKGPDESRIEFSSRPQKSAPAITRDLVYGHKCPWCGNVVQALFLTPEPVKLELYEETRVISQGDKNEGELLKIVPNSDDSSSAYKVDFYRTPKGNAQLIRLKNHLIVWKGLTSSDRDDFLEPGERCCKFIGFFNRNESDSLIDLAAVCNHRDRIYAEEATPVPLSFLSEWKPDYSWMKLEYRVLPAIGRGSSVLLVTRKAVKEGNTYVFTNLFADWDKQAAKKQPLDEADELLESTI